MFSHKGNFGLHLWFMYEGGPEGGLRDVSGRCEGGVENRPPSLKPLCTQVLSEIEGGLALKMKNPYFFWIQKKKNERKGS